MTQAPGRGRPPARGSTDERPRLSSRARKRAALDAARKRRLRTRLAVLAGVLGVAALATFLVRNTEGTRRPSAEDMAALGVQTFEVTSRSHTETPVDYPQIPPVGGDHYPVWQNCGYYPDAIDSGPAVHSLEHGAVWITYQPDLSANAVDALRDRAARSYVLMSPFEGLPSPVVASAWGVQLQLQSPDDARLDDFLQAYRQGPQTPEPGAVCTNGLGTPA